MTTVRPHPVHRSQPHSRRVRRFGAGGTGSASLSAGERETADDTLHISAP